MDRIGVSVIGASNRSVMMFNYAAQHSESVFITGVYDIIPGKAELMKTHFNLTDAKVYASLDEAVGDPAATAAFISTTDSGHAECAIPALRSGKHVFCEKPLALSVEDCDAIIEAARTSKGVFYVGMNLRHGPVYEVAHRLLSEGQIGRLTTIEANEYYTGGRTYFRRWNRLRRFGGGLWLTKACHDFDLLNWFAGGNARRVSAFSSLSHYRPRTDAASHCRICPLAGKCPDYWDLSRGSESLGRKLAMLTEQATGEKIDICLYNSDKDTFDNGIAVVEYDNDVRATYTCNVVSARDTRQLRLMGTEGSIEADNKLGQVHLWKRFSKDTVTYDVTERMKSGHGGADSGIMNDFFRCCRTGTSPRSSWAEGRACVQVGLAARESCDTGQTVTIQ